MAIYLPTLFVFVAVLAVCTVEVNLKTFSELRLLLEGGSFADQTSSSDGVTSEHAFYDFCPREFGWSLEMLINDDGAIAASKLLDGHEMSTSVSRDQDTAYPKYCTTIVGTGGVEAHGTSEVTSCLLALNCVCVSRACLLSSL